MIIIVKCNDNEDDNDDDNYARPRQPGDHSNHCNDDRYCYDNHDDNYFLFKPIFEATLKKMNLNQKLSDIL